MYKRIVVIIIIFIYLMGNAGCPAISCIEANYSFAINARFLPEQDTLHIGDTLFLSSSTSKKMTDLQSGKEINYTGALNLGSTLGIGELIPDSVFPRDAVSDFDYFSVKGRIYNDPNIPSPNGVQQITYEEFDTGYELKVGIIAKRKGVYAMGIGDGLSTGRKGVGGCQKASFAISLINSNKHEKYYQEWRPDYILTETELRHLYCFVVK